MPRRLYLQQIVAGARGSIRVLQPQSALLRRWELAQSPSWLAETQIEQSSPAGLEEGVQAVEPPPILAPALSPSAFRFDATTAPDAVRGSEPAEASTLIPSIHAPNSGPFPEIEGIYQTLPPQSAIRQTQWHRNDSGLVGGELSREPGPAIRSKTASPKPQPIKCDGFRPRQLPDIASDERNDAETEGLARHAAQALATSPPAFRQAPIPAQRNASARSIDLSRDDAGPSPPRMRVARTHFAVKPRIDSRPEVRIGTVEVVIAPPAAPVVSPSRSPGERPPALSRGYSSAIGLRQR